MELLLLKNIYDVDNIIEEIKKNLPRFIWNAQFIVDSLKMKKKELLFTGNNPLQINVGAYKGCTAIGHTSEFLRTGEQGKIFINISRKCDNLKDNNQLNRTVLIIKCDRKTFDIEKISDKTRDVSGIKEISIFDYNDTKKLKYLQIDNKKPIHLSYSAKSYEFFLNKKEIKFCTCCFETDIKVRNNPLQLAQEMMKLTFGLNNKRSKNI